MTIEERKNLVIHLLSMAHAKAENEAEIIRNESDPSLEFVYEHLRKYILAKFLLSEDCMEDQLQELGELSLARSIKLDPKMIKKFDKAVPCDNVSSASAKKVMLLYAIQKDLNIHPEAELLISQKDVRGLSVLVHSVLQ